MTTIYTEYLSDFAEHARGDHWETAYFVGDVEVSTVHGPTSDPRIHKIAWLTLPRVGAARMLTSLDAALRDAAGRGEG